MTIEERIETTLRSAQPGSALRSLVAELAREGRRKEQIIALFEAQLVKQRGRSESGEQDEEVLLDVLDALRGWCHPAGELLPESRM